MDSNQRPSAYEAPALPLSYVANLRVADQPSALPRGINVTARSVALSIALATTTQGRSHFDSIALAFPAQAVIQCSCLSRESGNPVSEMIGDRPKSDSIVLSGFRLAPAIIPAPGVLQ